MPDLKEQYLTDAEGNKIAVVIDDGKLKQTLSHLKDKLKEIYQDNLEKVVLL